MDSPIPKKKKRMSVVTTNDAGEYTLQQGSGGVSNGGIPTCGSQPQSSYFASDAPSSSSQHNTTSSSSSNNPPPNNPNNDNKHKPVSIGQEVNITSRTWSGINKPGGHAKITNIHYNDNNEAKMVDVKYSLGGKEQNIQLKYVTEPTMELGTRGNRRNNRGGGGGGEKREQQQQQLQRQSSNNNSSEEINSLAQSTVAAYGKQGVKQQQLKQPLPQDITSNDREMKKEQSSLRVSASMLSLPCEPLNTPKEDENIIAAAGGGVSKQQQTNQMDGSNLSGEESRKRRHSVEEDILLGGGVGSRNSSTNSLSAAVSMVEQKKKDSDGMPDTKKIKIDNNNTNAQMGGTDEGKTEEEEAEDEDDDDELSFKGDVVHHKPAPWSARQNLGVKSRSNPSIMAPSFTSPSSNVHDTPNSAASTTSQQKQQQQQQQQQQQPIRWRTHQMAEDYISLASSITLPPTKLGPYGYNSSMGQYPIEQVTTLGYLTSPLRRPTVIEKWNPYEVSIFEAALSSYGKMFHTIQKHVKTKSTKEIIEFYYIWKKTSHGKRWKNSFVEEIMESDSDDDDEEEEGSGGSGESDDGEGSGSGEKNGKKGE